MGAAASTSKIPIPNHNTPIIASSIPFPVLGVKLSYVNEFYSICGGKDTILNMSTAEINENFQKKITEKYKLSFCDYLNYLKHPAVGKAKVFISHAWKYKFVDVIDALQHYFKDTPDIIMWFDLFSNNQHLTVDLDFNWWCGTFKTAIKKFNHTVMVLSPWNNPIPLTRGWCLFELYCTKTTKSKFGIAMNDENKNQFLKDITEGLANEEVNKMLNTINAEKSECFKEEDRQRNFEIVRKDVGFHNINSMIFEEMRDWVIEITKTAMDKEVDEIKKVIIMSSLADLYNNQGRYNEAEPLFINCLDRRKQLLGNDDPKTLLSMNNLASLYADQGRYEEAEPLYQDCLERRSKTLGENNPETLNTEQSLAVLNDKLGRYKEAESLYLDCLQKHKIALGDNHPNTIGSISNLANFYNNQEKYRVAEPLYEECLKKYQVALGDNHLETINIKQCLAILYRKQKRYDKAEPLYVDCLTKYNEILGENHPDTLSSLQNLAVLYHNQGRYIEAELLYIDCLKKYNEILGEDHPDTTIVAENYNIFLEEKLEKEKKLFYICKDKAFQII